MEPYQPFPVDALPPPLANFVRQGSIALGCDSAYIALPALAVAASVIGNTRTIRLKRSWEEPSVLWVGVIGDSGTLKSPAYAKAVSHLFKLQRKILDRYKGEKARYEEERAEYQAAKKKAKEHGADAGTPPKQPTLQRVVCSDVTIEKLAEMLEDSPRGLIVARDELAAWLASFSRYKAKQGGTDLPNWLEMHRAGTIIVDRKTGERCSLFVERAAVCITGGIQPGVLARALTPEFLESGLAARLLMAMPPKLPKKWSEVEITLEVEKAYHDLIEKLLTLDFAVRDGEQVPHALTLSPEAKDAWVAFYNDWGREQASVEGDLAASFSKLEGYAARLTLLHHVIIHTALDTSDLCPVALQSVQAGIALSRWFACEARRIYSTLSESTEERNRRQLLEWVESRGGKTTAKKLQNSNSRKYKTTNDATAALDGLVAGGYGRWVERPGTVRGGRPTKDFVLYPTTDETDETSEEDDEDDDGPSPKPPDETYHQSDETFTNSKDFEVSSVSSVVGKENTTNDGEEEGLSDGNKVSSGDMEVPSAPTGYLLIQDNEALETVATALDGTVLVGLDIKTTDPDHRSDRICLLSLACETIDGGAFVYIVDCPAADPRSLRDLLADKTVIAHDMAFRRGFLTALGFTPAIRILDSLLMSQLVYEGKSREFHSLAKCVRRELGRAFDQPHSNWSDQLTDMQLQNVADASALLLPLYQALRDKIQRVGLAEDRSVWRALTWGGVDAAMAS
jgi:hypothetical protein